MKKMFICMISMLLFACVDREGGEVSGGEPPGGEPSGGEPSGGEVSGGEPPGVVPPTGIGLYEVNDVQFHMREIPAGDGVASFLMAETEVTQELYEAVMGSNPSDFTG